MGHLTRYFSRQFEYKQKASNCFSNLKYVSVNVEGFFSVGEHLWCEAILLLEVSKQLCKLCLLSPQGIPSCSRVVDTNSWCFLPSSLSQALKNSLGSPPKLRSHHVLLILAHFYLYSNISNSFFSCDSRGTFENLPSGIYMLHLRNGGQVKPAEQTGVWKLSGGDKSLCTHDFRIPAQEVWW